MYSDDVQEILGQIPHWIIRWGIAVLTGTVLVLLSTSWFVKYPEVLSGPVVLTSQTPPVDIVSRSMGRVYLLTGDGDRVREKEILGYIGSSSEYKDMMRMAEAVGHISFTAGKEQLKAQLLQVQQLPALSLGEVQPAFENYLGQVRSLLLFYELDAHRKQIEQLREKMATSRELNRRLTEQKELLSKELEHAQTVFLSDSTLRAREFISERELNNSRLTLLQRRRSLEEAEIAILNNRALIRDYEGSIEQLGIEQKQQESQLLTGAEESLKVVRSQFLAWKQTYVLESPFDGTVTFFDHLADSRFVQSGDPLMTVIPDHPGVYGLVHIPVSGSGRVKTGQSIHISLENYPVEEVGQVTGIVEHISPLPRENSYSIRVRLPDGLRTSYGLTLEFHQQMQGTADIITEDLRLAERFFYQFKSLIDRAG